MGSSEKFEKISKVLVERKKEPDKLPAKWDQSIQRRM